MVEASAIESEGTLSLMTRKNFVFLTARENRSVEIIRIDGARIAANRLEKHHRDHGIRDEKHDLNDMPHTLHAHIVRESIL